MTARGKRALSRMLTRSAARGAWASPFRVIGRKRPRWASRLDRCRERLGGQLERERGALVGLRLDPDVAVHRPHQLAADVEAEARPADPAPVVGIEAVELVEDPLLLAGRDPEA